MQPSYHAPRVCRLDHVDCVGHLIFYDSYSCVSTHKAVIFYGIVQNTYATVLSWYAMDNPTRHSHFLVSRGIFHGIPLESVA